ncbi:hypothetical protein JT05_03075 [Desulfosporosinus sp. Tol-M]|jgi:hypothetical protein|nr:hypothetical protein JT05_03075 [Desulfosporosinus sp. Tol-M]
MQCSSSKFYKIIGAICSIIVSIPYIIHAYGPTEREVVIWGVFSLAWGIILLFLSISMYEKIVTYIGFVIVGLIQIPPIILWFTFHGYGISDNTPSSSFIAHWGYGIPHIIIFLICAAILYKRINLKT